MRSLSLAEKIDRRFSVDSDANEAIALLNHSKSPARFDSQTEFINHLVEGNLLNISVIGSRALSVPNGEYLVWMTDAGHTMLVPTGSTTKNGEVYEHNTDAYEVQTRDLLANWNRIERVIAEDWHHYDLSFDRAGYAHQLQEMLTRELPKSDWKWNGRDRLSLREGVKLQPDTAQWLEIVGQIAPHGGAGCLDKHLVNENQQPLPQPGQPNENSEQAEEGDHEEGQAGEFRSQIDASTVDRTPIMRAMQDRGFTVSSLAAEVGVDPPAISRILRRPKDVQGDPGGRNPSMGLASQICNALRIDPTAAFPDIFTVNQEHQPRHQPGNEGSGSHSHNKGGGKWTQGNAGVAESVVREEAARLGHTFRDSMNGVSFDTLWNRAFLPALRRATPDTNLIVFTEGVISELNVAKEWYYGKNGKPTGPFDQQTFEYLFHTGQLPPSTWVAKVGDPAWQRGSQLGLGPKPTQKIPSAHEMPYEAAATADTASYHDPMGGNQKFQAAQDKMNTAIMPGIQDAFKKAMEQLRDDLQKNQLKAGANPKIAPHAWKLADKFYRHVMKSGMEFAPKWKAKPAAGNSYDAGYEHARTAYNQYND